MINPKSLKYIDRPAILVSNHPSTLMDPMNAAKEVNGIVFFLANAGMFAHWFTNWFFSTFYCIKVERPTDVDGRKIQNDKAFEMCNNFLVNRNGVLYIAAEGGSKVTRSIRPLKTGTARIAFAAEKAKNFQLGLTIVPVGLSYSDPLNFRSDVIVHTAEPIRVADFRELWEKNNRKGVLALTKEIHHRLKATVVHTESEEMEQLVQQLELIEQTEKPKSLPQQIKQSQKWVKKLTLLEKKNPNAFANFQQNTSTYFEELEKNQLTNQAIIQKNSTKDILVLVFGFPFFLYGYINNFLAFYTPAWVNKKMNLYQGYTPAVKVVIGLITVPFFYWLQCKLLTPYFLTPFWKWVYLASLLPLGLLAWHYLTLFRKVGKRRKFTTLNANIQHELLEQRNSIKEQFADFLKKDLSSSIG